ncbi:MAG: hypothetical protein Q7V57_10550 [Actinomycetota bacterium]|nr:hypothetical protein [Actinomycetota bacterium]
MNKRSTTLLLGAFAATALLGACSDDKKSSGGSSDAAYCAQIKDYKTTADSLDSVFDNPDSDGVKTAFTTMQAMIHDLDKNPPAKIASDVHAMTTAVDRIVAIFEQYDWDIIALSTAPEFAELSAELDGEAFTTASDNLEAYSVDVCGLPADS